MKKTYSNYINLIGQGLIIMYMFSFRSNLVAGFHDAMNDLLSFIK